MPLPSLNAALAQHRVLHLATTGPEGPHSAPLFYALVNGGPAVVWFSAPDSLHSRHLPGPVAVSIAPASPELDAIFGVQLRGFATLSPRPAAHRAVYLARYPVEDRIRPDHRVYLFVPSWARLVTGFTHQEWDLDG